MPTVLNFHGLRIFIYLNDHRPAHVHVTGNGCEAVFRLHCPTGPPELRENYGFSNKVLNNIAEELGKNLRLLCRKWSEYHGPD
ncbi:MAG: DUF4160 domain-containing protein [Pseudomonadota bacterium]|nr:DUF4160 domain-containing protein [Pseudomonadota bacterium]